MKFDFPTMYYTKMLIEAFYEEQQQSLHREPQKNSDTLWYMDETSF